jgi:hypothetical protein
VRYNWLSKLLARISLVCTDEEGQAWRLPALAVKLEKRTRLFQMAQRALNLGEQLAFPSATHP